MADTRTLPVRHALLFFIAWTAATWFFEGRISTLLRPDAVIDRIVYALVVNLLFGVAGALWLLRRYRDHSNGAIGFPAATRTAISVAAGLVLGFGSYVAQGAPSLDPIVVTNAFAQVFVVSAAEVMVCWALVGTGVLQAARARGPKRAVVVAALAASVLFGLYHYAHSAPFNTLPMVLLLTVVGLVTSVFFFISRDVAGTIVFHNFLGTFGVVQALTRADALAPLERLQPPLLATAALTAAVLAGGYVLHSRRAHQPVHA